MMKRIAGLFAPALVAGFLLAGFGTGALAQSCSGTPNQNTICAGPSSGGSGFPNFRNMVGGDVDPVGGTTRGSIMERGASGWTGVVPGTSGLPWVSNGAGADPAYQLLTTPNINFTQSGTGASTRTLDSRLKESFSVKDFGALGNGSTNDATSIQNAVTACAGSTLYFPNGTYLINSTITQSATPCSFIMAGGVTFTGTGQMPGAFTNTAQLQSGTYFYNAQTGGANNVGNTTLGAEFIAPNSYIGNGVAAYFGAATPTSGTFNGFVWAINSVTNCNPNTGTYNCIGYELDFNNFSGVNGKGVALLIASVSSFNPQYAIEIMRPGGTADWQTGIYVSKFQSGVVIDATGAVAPSFGLRLTGTYSNTGIDLSGGSFPTAFKSTGFSVDSSGNVNAAGAFIATLVGGTLASSTLTLQSTTGVGTTDGILFKVGNAGGTTAATILDSGVWRMGTPSFTANGAVATAMSSLGPAGSHTTIQEWLTVQDSAGTVRYIPAF